MPSHTLHITLDELIFGRGNFYPEVHKYLDQMQPLMQSNHRKFFHDQTAVNEIYESTGDWNKSMSAYYHILLDQISDEVGQEHAISELLTRMNLGVYKNATD